MVLKRSVGLARWFSRHDAEFNGEGSVLAHGIVRVQFDRERSRGHETGNARLSVGQFESFFDNAYLARGNVEWAVAVDAVLSHGCRTRGRAERGQEIFEDETEIFVVARANLDAVDFVTLDGKSDATDGANDVENGSNGF